MHQHQHGPNCQHGHGPQHGHGHGHGPMPAMGFGGQPQQQSPEEYFRNLKKRWSDKESRVFFWQELLHGVIIDRVYENYGLDFMRSLTCQVPQMIILTIQNMVNFEWIPYRLKPITSGLFFPLFFLLFFNINVVVGVAATDQTLRTMAAITLILYVLVGLRGNSRLNTDSMKTKTSQIIEVRPYLQNPQMNCQACGVIRLFRAIHCPMCKTCVGKHSRHSLVFGSCIGASNQFLALLFFLSLAVTFSRILLLFILGNGYGTLTKIMFYLLNVPLCWMSFKECLQFLVFNLIYGVTEQQLKMWPMLQYLQKIPERGFQNNVDQGFFLNLQSSLMALFGIKGYESEEGWAKPQLTFPIVDPKGTYKVNWDKAVIYLIPQIPFHKNRAQILQMMQRDQPRMIEMFRLQARFRKELMEEPGFDQLNEFQIQQKMAMKMQAHMMRNMPQMPMPSPEQQRNMQLQMLTHMKREFASDPDLEAKLGELETKLRDGSLSPIETNMQMRMLQQELMGRRMSKAMKQMQEAQAQKQQEEKSKVQEQQAPMRNMADEDL